MADISNSGDSAAGKAIHLQKQLDDFNSTEVLYPGPALLHAAFEQKAEDQPDAVALRSGQRTVSYGELNSRANQVAHALVARGIRKGDFLPVCMERSIERFYALLGIVKAGAAYVPLDPSYPIERLRFMVEDIGSDIALVDESGTTALATLQVAPLSILAKEMSEGDGEKTPTVAITSSDTAYAIYTSGSTGKPKAAINSHGAIHNRLEWMQSTFPLNAGDKALHKTPFSFDVSVWELFWPLRVGAEIVVAPPGAHRDPQSLAALISQHSCRIVHFVPSMLQAFLADRRGATLSSCRWIVCSGEALSTGLRDSFMEEVNGPELHNLYGPTEAAVDVTWWHEKRETGERGCPKNLIPIGQPIANTRMYVLDEKLQPVQIGKTGELYIAGVQVANGYLNRPDLTLEKFVDDPFNPGEKMYRTGDLGRWLANGNIVYEGRIDFQVKLRGLRIELGEIESALDAHPAVSQSVVTVMEVVSGEQSLVAHVVRAVESQSDGGSDEKALQEYLAKRVPEYMVPSFIVGLSEMPISSNGKLDRKALPVPATTTKKFDDRSRAETDVERQIAAVWQKHLGLQEMPAETTFFDAGGTSLMALKVMRLVAKKLSVPLTVTDLFRCPTVRSLAAYAEEKASKLGGKTESKISQNSVGRTVSNGPSPEDVGVAIVGMSCRLPGASSPSEFWENIVAGKESITWFDKGDLDPSIADKDDPNYIPARGVVDDCDKFDARFFGENPRSAEMTCPQQRIMLELAWAALEDAGVAPTDFDGLIGVYAGVYSQSYYINNVLARPDKVAQLGSFQSMVGNDKDFVATRIAHKLDLRGPAVSVHSACSTSLVAVAQAVESLLGGSCDVALAGGASISSPTNSGHLYTEGAMFCPDGHCRPFDKQAAGTMFSDGAAMITLKRLSDAKRDGDRVYAVIRGAAVNNDGANKMSFTAPSVEGQAAVISKALNRAGFSADTISYIEGHGTATPLGDPIEVAALTDVFRRETDNSNFCALGSVKGNIGHVTAAAGVAGLIKTALGLWHKKIPGCLHFEEPNRELSLETSPFYVNSKTMAWPKGATKRRAGISSFGVGGTNAHVVVEEADQAEVTEASVAGQGQDAFLLPLSGRDDAALSRVAAGLAQYLRNHEKLKLADIAKTLSRRQKQRARSFVVAGTVPEAIAALEKPLVTKQASRKSTKISASAAPELVFLYPGQGSQYVNMGKSFYQSEPLYKKVVDELCESASPAMGRDLREILFPKSGDEGLAAQTLRETRYTQPALFVVGYALTQLWAKWGVRPDLLVGHSIGEFVGAAVSGVMDPAEALGLVVTRGKLMQSLEPGAMLSVRLPASELVSRLPDGVDLAAANGPSLCVVAGPTELVESFAKTLECQEVRTRLLHTSHAFHSRMMDSIVEPFLDEVKKLRLQAPSIPIVSSVTGNFMGEDVATDPGYWAEHLRVAVRYNDAVAKLWEKPERVLLEVGPRTTLATLARQQATDKKAQLAISSLADAATDNLEWTSICSAAGKLFTAGIEVNDKVFFELGQPVTLPTYPFARDRHWVEAPTNILSTQNLSEPVADVILPRTDQGGQSQVASMTASIAIDNSQEVSGKEGSNMDKKQHVEIKLRALIEKASGVEIEAGEESLPFVELGLDSLFLTQVSITIKNEFGVKVTFRELMGDAGTLFDLSQRLAGELPEAFFADLAVGSPPAIATPGHVPVPAQILHSAPLPTAPVATNSVQGNTPSNGTYAAQQSSIERVIEQQMQLMAEQLRVLSGNGVAQSHSVQSHSTQHAATSAAPITRANRQVENVVAKPPAPAANQNSKSTKAAEKPQQAFGPQARIDNTSNLAVTLEQKEYLDGLIKRYSQMTAKSKAYTDKHRPHMADPRVVSGFTPHMKEVTYSPVVDRSKGGRLWDIDGNEYVDLTNGFGADFFGHSPQVVIDAVHEQLDKGIELGPQHPLAGEVAELLCELTGVERVAFCNTGSEAVLGACRIARTVTGKDKIVIFDSAYHGITDQVIVRGTRKLRSVPAAAGIPAAHVGETIVLPYGDAESLKVIEREAGSIAAVMVEPVQGRRPELVPTDFLQELRALTKRLGCAFIFDEIITGFRIRQGGAQEFFGIRADLVTYGKVLGGGMPIAAIGGSSEFMDALDGGAWKFGDSSGPTQGVTYFAGTFVRHPPALAAAKAALTYLKEQGPELQHRVNARCENLVTRLNEMFDGFGVPIKLVRFGSVMRIRIDPSIAYSEVLFLSLKCEGLHIYDGFPCYVTIGHTDEDIDAIVSIFTRSVSELVKTGFLPGQVGGGGNGKVANSNTGAAANAAGDQTVPCTPSQREMWALGRMDPSASLSYNQAFGIRLSGKLSLEKLSAAIQGVIGRHQALRSRITSDGRSLRFDGEVCNIGFKDLSSSSSNEQEEIIQNDADRELVTPFDLENGPVFRAKVIRLAEEEHYVLFAAHHTACDGWSISVLLGDLGAMYSGRSLAEPYQFGSYAKHQASQDKVDDQKASEVYWSQKFAELPEPMDLPTDYARPQVRTYQSDRLDWRLSEKRMDRIAAVSKELGCSRFVTLLAAFASYLSRITGQRDLVVAIPAAGQALVGEWELVGHCVRLLPIRVTFEEADTFENIAAQVRDSVIEGFEHGDISFGQLLSRLAIENDPSRRPLTPVIFNLDPELDGNLKMDGLSCDYVSHRRKHEAFEWSVNALEANGELVLECQYNTDIFSRENIAERMASFDGFMAAALAEIKKPAMIVDLPTVTDGDQKLLRSFNETSKSYPLASETLHSLFEKQCDKAPDAVALVFGNDSISYREMDEKANALANSLLVSGLEGGDFVGISMEQSTNRMIAIYAVLKAGGAYIPLDPDYPKERLQFFAADSKAKVILADSAGVDALGDALNNVWNLDDDTAAFIQGEKNIARPTQAVSSDSNAYMMYTSGSTGRPKGVPNTHRAVCNHLFWMQERFLLGASDTVLQHTAYSFDVSTWQVFWPLQVGAKVVLPKSREQRDLVKIGQLVEKHEITCLTFVPSMMQAFLARDLGSTLKSVNQVLCIGEALPTELCEALFAATATTELHNLYGPTEAAVAVSHWHCKRPDRGQKVETPPIGAATANTELYVLDQQMRLCPIGVAGEIYIGGLQVAEGYWNRPDLTSERFVQSPFDGDGTLYKTGDLASWRRDGNLMYLGRTDQQVKLRGLRIELGEIESALAEIDGVTQAAVSVYSVKAGDERLVSHIQWEPGKERTSTDLRRSLRKGLPDYMIPQHFVSVDSMPTTTSGKLDRKALQMPDDLTGGTRRARARPATDETQMLAALWADMLNISEVSLDDNFFDLGGHSILALDVVARIYEQTGVEVEPRELLLGTLEQVAAHFRGTAEGTLERKTVDAPKADPEAANQENLEVGRRIRRLTSRFIRKTIGK